MGRELAIAVLPHFEQRHFTKPSLALDQRWVPPALQPALKGLSPPTSYADVPHFEHLYNAMVHSIFVRVSAPVNRT